MDVTVALCLRAVGPGSRLGTDIEALAASLDADVPVELVLVTDGRAPHEVGEVIAALEGNVTVVAAAAERWELAAADATSASLLAFLAPGVTPEAGWLRRLTAALEARPAAAAAQPLIRSSADGRLLHAGGLLAAGGADGAVRVLGAGLVDPVPPELRRVRPAAVLSGACVMVRRPVLVAAGGLAALVADPSAPFGRLVVGTATVAAPDDAVEAGEPATVDDLRAAPEEGPAPAVVVVGPLGGDLAAGLHQQVEELCVTAARSGLRVVYWEPAGGMAAVDVDALAAAGVTCYPADADLSGARLQDRPRWRQVLRPSLAAVVATSAPDTIVFTDADGALALLDEARSFARAATVAVGLRRPPSVQPAGERARVLALLARADRVVCAWPDEGEALQALPGMADLEVVALGMAGGGERAVAPARITVTSRVPAFDVDRPLGRGRTSVVVPVWNNLDLTRACLETVRRYSPPDTEVIVVDNGSTDGTGAWLARQTDLVVISNGENRGFAAACNQGMAAATGEFVVLLNNDTRVPRRWLDGLLAPFSEAAVGAVGPRSNAVSGPQLAPGLAYRGRSEFGRVAEEWRRAHQGSVWPLDRLVGFCLALRRQAIDAVGGLDEAFGQGNFEDDDLCLRLKGAGWQLVVADEVLVHHEGSASFGQALFGAVGRGRRIFEEKWGSGVLAAVEPQVSAVLIARDEEEHLPDCLRSLRGLVDEVVVADTGSIDRTRRLAEAFGATVVDVAWTDDFAAARNAALAAARGRWALVVDADERVAALDPAAVTQLHRALHDGAANVYQLRIRSETGAGGGGTVWEHWLERLFVRHDFRYRGRLHETLVPVDGTEPRPVRLEGMALDHVGYRADVRAERDKLARNERIARAYYESDEGEPWYRAFVYARSALDADTKLRCYLECAELASAGSEAGHDAGRYRGEALAGAAYAALDLGDLERALALADEALAAAPGHAQARFVRGAALHRLGRLPEAAATLEALIAEGASGHELTADSRWWTVDGPAELATLRSGDGDHAATVALLLPGAQADPRQFGEWATLVRALKACRPATWLADVAEAAAPAPGGLLAAAPSLEVADALALCDALAGAGVPLAVVSLVAFQQAARMADAGRPAVDRSWLGRLATAEPHAVTALARRLEAGRPDVALELWRMAGDRDEAALGRARCQASLGSLEAAVDELGDLCADELEPADRLFVATLAAGVGATDFAARLLATVPPGTAGVDEADREAVAALL